MTKSELYPEIELPAAVLGHPSMISDAEKRLLFGVIARGYEGHGRIVDAGIFLGGSTMCFGLGLDENKNREEILSRWSKPIVSFERALINKSMFKHFERWGVDVGSAGAGDSFEPVLRKLIAPVEGKVDLKVGDITKASWPSDEPIEILFLDVVKTPEINVFVLKTFFPCLIPGKSLVIQQDYFLDLLPYLKIGQENLSDYFEFVTDVGPTAVFRLIKEIPEQLLQTDPMESLSVEEKLQLIERAADRAGSSERQFMTSLSKVYIAAEEFGGRRGLDELGKLVEKYPNQAPGVTKRQRVLHMYNTARRRMTNIAGLVSMHEYMVESIPEQVSDIIGRTSALERRFLYGVARDYVEGQGSVVDIGTFLGASAAALAGGLAENASLTPEGQTVEPPLRLFDYSEFDNADIEFMRRQGFGAAATATGATERLKQNIENSSSLLKLQIGPLSSWALDTDEPIEVLHIDRVNSAEDFQAMYLDTVPRLIPGRGLLILRNYFGDQLAHMKIMQESNSAAFEFVGAINTAAIFKSKEPASRATLEKMFTATLTPKEKTDLIDQAAERAWNARYRALTRLASLRVLYNDGEYSKLESVFKNIEDSADYSVMDDADRRAMDRGLGRARGLLGR